MLENWHVIAPRRCRQIDLAVSLPELAQECAAHTQRSSAADRLRCGIVLGLQSARLLAESQLNGLVVELGQTNDCGIFLVQCTTDYTFLGLT